MVEDNSFGTHEFLALAEAIGAEPFIVGNAGSGTVEEMADALRALQDDQEATRKLCADARAWLEARTDKSA